MGRPRSGVVDVLALDPDWWQRGDSISVSVQGAVNARDRELTLLAETVVGDDLDKSRWKRGGSGQLERTRQPSERLGRTPF